MVRVPGDHVANIKNRSSKQYICLTKRRSYVKTLSNSELAKLNSPDAIKERNRRDKKNSK